MPVEGIPDRKLHRYCLHCHRWHYPEEGKPVMPSGGPLTALHNLGAVLTSDESALKFACFRCLGRRKLVRIALFATLALCVVIVLILEQLGVLRR